MPDLVTNSPSNPEFARIVDLSRLDGATEFAFDLRPGPEEAAALARLMGARSLRKMRFAGRLEARPEGGWTLEAELGATVVQSCVVTLEPVTTRIEQKVARRYLPDAGLGGREVVVPIDADDEIEPLADRIDLGLVAIEALALALPAYPRKPGAELRPADRSDDDDAARPFDGLAALRDRLGNPS